MSVYYPSGCTNLPDVSCSDCPKPELGRVRAFWAQRVDFNFIDITNPVEWQAAIVARQVYLFPYGKGSVEFAENMQDGFGNVDQSLMSYSITANLMEPSFPNNCTFWNQIKRSNFWKLGYKTETQFYLSSVPATWIPKAPVADDIKSRVTWNIMVKFVQEDLPCPFTGPAGTFDRCIEPA